MCNFLDVSQGKVAASAPQINTLTLPTVKTQTNTWSWTKCMCWISLTLFSPPVPGQGAVLSRFCCCSLVRILVLMRKGRKMMFIVCFIQSRSREKRKKKEKEEWKSCHHLISAKYFPSFSSCIFVSRLEEQEVLFLCIWTWKSFPMNWWLPPTSPSLLWCF